ncbi:hypothetical protein ACG02S_13615 [Roseateles sp. DC23W]|uniref:TraB family protein n=1 Tax=Pelomonas dachongensis TaxID=3299029 RepID=A0ABW7EP43_9BURK
MAGKTGVLPQQALRDGERLRVRLRTLLGAVLGLAALLSLPVLLQVQPWLPLTVLAASAVLAGLPAAWWARRRRKRVAWPWIKSSLGLACAVCVALAAPIYYLALVTVLKPAAQPQVVLSNGSRTLTFQGMMHVGSDAYYRAVMFDIGKALSEGAAIYYEGVIPDPQGDAWLAGFLGTDEDLSASYKQLAGACGLVFQNDYFALLAMDRKVHPDRHVAADVSSLQMRREFDRLLATDMAFVEAMQARETARSAPSTGGQPLTAFVAWQQRGTESQRALAGTVCRGLMTLLVRPRRSHDARPRDPFDAVVIDYRNRELVRRLLADPRDRVFLTYGSAHLPGVYALLKQSDPRWRVESVKWLRSIAAPENVRGQLDLTP